MATTGLIKIHEHNSTGNKDDYWAYWSVTVASINSKIQNCGIPSNATIDRVGLVVNSDYDGGLGDNPYKAYLQFGFGNATNSISDYLLTDTRITKQPTNYPSDRGVDVTNRFDKANRKFNSSVGTYFVMCVHTESAWISAQKAQYAYVVVDYTPHTHSYTSKVTKAATCTATGVRTYTCSCGDSYTETIAKDSSNHTGSQTTIPAVAATCTTAGKTEGKKWSCCNAIITAQQTINATGHNNNTTIPAVSPTCTSTGLTEGKKCSVCGTVTVAQTSVAALGHLYASPKYSWASDGTSCSVTGTCSRSGCGSTKTINANISSLVTTQPSCLTDGVKTFTATFGETWATNQTKNITLSATGHSFGSITQAKSATCLSSGNYAYKKCSNCNLYFLSDATTNSTGGSSNTSPFLINQKDHSFTGEIKSDGNYKDATHSFKCVNGCNNYGNAAKHTWDDGKITTQPSCESTGIKTYTCSIANCGGTYTETVPANGHIWVSATCTTPKTCSVCGAKEGEALGHDYDIEVVDPTNSSLGYTIYTCKRDGCGYTCTDNYKCLITVTCDTTMGYVSGSGTYATGTSVTISATANSGYKFVGWSDGVSSNTRTITADNSMTYTAIFASDKLYFGTAKPKKIFVGEQEVKAIYIDTIKVYG